jgi:2-isopropylmalate synthase
MSYRYPIIEPVSAEPMQWPRQRITTSPSWCAVDLRDGNQALPNPMTPDQKLEYFKLLVKMGFKQIEVGFPAASRDEFDFTRRLIEQKLIPSDVTISVLTQARPHLIEKTLASLAGAHSAVVHFYIATSKLHYKHVFGFERDSLVDTARQATRQIREGRAAFAPGFLGLEFSPEEFTDTELNLSIELCDAVVDEWQVREGEKVILNLPATVERRPPTHYADMIEIFRRRLKNIKNSVISLHAHNDQGCAVAATEMALMAGGERVEGTLFGHGERTGNVDLVTMALNFQARNIATGLDFSNLPLITETVARITNMEPHQRHPYAGELVFTAFSGSHQDAIGKCMANQKEVAKDFDCDWKIPYLHIDPRTLGRNFEKFVRINSQSGKGGISYVMKEAFGINLPKELLLDFAKKVQKLADEKESELQPKEMYELFDRNYRIMDGPYQLKKCYPRPDDDNPEMIHAEVLMTIGNKDVTLKGSGNGPISAFAEALRSQLAFNFTLERFEELSVTKGADSDALAYISISRQGEERWVHGVGLAANIDQAGFKAILSCVNQLSR